MSETQLTRRDLTQLVLLVSIVIMLWLVFLGARPVGENVGNLATVIDIRADRSSPATTNSAADVSLIVFSDYQCPACRTSERSMERAVSKDGKVRIVYKEWPIFGKRSERAARVALASAYQGIYPAVHQALMTGTLPDEAMLRETVRRAGGDWQLLEADLARHRSEIEAELARNRLQAFSLGLEGTPAYLIGPILVRGALGERDFTRAFAAARKADRASSRR